MLLSIKEYVDRIEEYLEGVDEKTFKQKLLISVDLPSRFLFAFLMYNMNPQPPTRNPQPPTCNPQLATRNPLPPDPQTEHGYFGVKFGVKEGERATQIVATIKRPYDKNRIKVTDPISYFHFF